MRLFLQGARPNGAHVWLPFDGDLSVLTGRWAGLIAACPPDTVWSVTSNDGKANPALLPATPVAVAA